jgi:hypothetical protein
VAWALLTAALVVGGLAGEEIVSLLPRLID